MLFKLFCVFIIYATLEVASAKPLFAAVGGEPLVHAAIQSQDSLPKTFPGITVSTNVSPSSGAIFLSNFDWADYSSDIVNYLLILRNDGSPLWYRQMPAGCRNFTCQPNGLLTYFDSHAGKIYAMDSSYTIVDTFACGNGRKTSGNECQILPNKHVLLIAYDTISYDMSKIASGGDPNAKLVNNYIQELDSNGNLVFEWNAMQHYRILDATGIDFTSEIVDPYACNAVTIDTDGNFIVTSANQSEITKISRDSSGIIWRLGGVNNQFHFIGEHDSLWFSLPQDARRIPNGDVTFFDVGYLNNPPCSRAVEYRLDETAKTCTLVWQYRDTVFGQAVYTLTMGSVQRLASGNTVIGWGLISNPAVTEVTPAGEKIYEMGFQPTNASYRAYRFNWPGASDAVPPSKALQPSPTLSQNSPNPVSMSTPLTSISYSLPSRSHIRLSLSNILGQTVRVLTDESEDAGEHQYLLGSTGLPSGTYSYTLQVNGTVLTRMMSILR